MTRPPDDEPTLWLKQVPRSNPDGPAVWATRLLKDHETVARSREQPAPETLGFNDRVQP